jgi:hypothetical protein
MNRTPKVCFAIVVLILSAAVARADVVTDWNVIALQTIGSLGSLMPTHARPGPSAILDIATVHAAMHDAIQAFQHRYESYAPPIPNATGSPIAAAATAAHDVLVARTLDQGPAFSAALDTLLHDYLDLLGLLGDPGALVGQEAASRVLAMRGTIGTYPYPPDVFTGGTGPGEWRPTLPAFASMAAPWLGNVEPFALKDPSQLGESTPPFQLGSGQYAREFDEVKSLGRLDSPDRTPEQTALALFYSDNFLTLLQRTLRTFVGAKTLDVGDVARTFALANIAAADAVINAWHEKKFWNFWRPITAIQEAATDGNPRTDADPTWLPQIATPPYADHTSGANNVTGAITRVLELLFGDKNDFVVTSVIAGTTPIQYHRFSEMADDVVDVRIYQGIHFRRADVVGRRQGKRSADWAVSHVLKPTN